MPVRLLRPYNGQNANTLYVGTDEAILRAIGIADDYIENATNFVPFASQAFRAFASSFSTGSPVGSFITSFSNPFAGQGRGITTYTLTGTVPPQVALSATGRSLVVGSTAAVAGTIYSVNVTATSGDGLLTTQPATLSFMATVQLPLVAGGGGTPGPAPTPTPTPTPTPSARTTFVVPSGGAMIYEMDPDKIAQADGSRVTSLTDPVSGITATATAGLGPLVVKNVNNGHAVLRYANVNTERLSLGKPAAIVAACATANDWSLVVVMKDAKGTEGNSPAFGDNFSTNGFICMSSVDSGFGNKKIRHDFAGATAANVRTFVYSGERIGTLGKGRQYSNGMMTGTDAMTLAQAYDLFIGYAQNNGTGNFQFNGDILYIAIMTGNLTAPEALQQHLWACNKYGEASPLAGRTYFPVFDGDSITYGIEATAMTFSFPSQLAVKRGWKWGQWANVGKPSATVASSGTNANTMMDKATRDVDGYADVTGLPVVLVSGEWYNQGGGGGTTSGGAILANNNRLYATTRKVTGKFVYQLGWTSTASADRNGAGRDGFNASLMSNLGDYNSMVAMHLNALVGVDAQGTNTTYINGAHPTNAGYSAMRDEIDTGLINAGYAS